MKYPLIAALPFLALLGAAPATAPPLKTITNVHVSALCRGLGRNIGPAIGIVLANDRIIAGSRPFFKSYVRDASIASQSAEDMDVMHLEGLIRPLVANTRTIERLLDEPFAFPKAAPGQPEGQLTAMRSRLREVLAEQERALDVISGFVDTQQLGELQAAGHQYDSAINSSETSAAKPAQPAPTAAPAAVLNAGVGDPLRKYDPRFTPTGSLLGANPLNAFDQAIAAYQQNVKAPEDQTAKLVMTALPACSAKPVQPSPSATP